MLSVPIRTRPASVAIDARRVSIRIVFFVVEALAFAVAFALASDLRQLAPMAAAPASLAAWMSHSVPSHFICYVVAVCVTLFFFWERGIYHMRHPVMEELPLLARLILSGAVIEAALLFLLSEAPLDKGAVLLTWAIALVLVPGARLALKWLLLVLGVWARPAVIVGDGTNATATYRALRNERLLGYKVKAFLGGPAVASLDARITIGKDTIPVLPVGDDVFRTLRRLGNPRVILALDTLAEAEAAFNRFHTLGNLMVIPPIRGLPLHGMEISHFFGEDILIMRVRNNLGRGGMLAIKRVFDIVTASLLLVGLSWLIAYLIVRVRRTGTPVFYGHMRIGQGGRKFRCWKFRTMVPDAEVALQDLLTQPGLRREWDTHFKLKNDPRVTRIGAFLRRTSLDELPQLWNVLKGDMSLVGPRPIVEDELPRYRDNAKFYLQVKPGITGLWQVSGRSNASYDYRVRLDTWYVKNWGLWYDLVILVKTARTVLTRAGAY